MTNSTPQIIITLHPQTGQLQAELPGYMATRRKVDIKAEEAGATLLRMLQAQMDNRAEIGEDGSPTQAQVLHWERHATWASAGCRFCHAEGRSKPEAPKRERRATTVVKNGEVEVRLLKPGASGAHLTLSSKKAPEDMGL